ncbi:MAG: Ada metal-binding domain-containing protein, partial [Pseudomonadota bacterium]
MQTTRVSLPDAEMHAAVEQRDATYDGRFVFGVVTTGIVCRPTCPARTAHPENRRFFATVDDALKAGFRPCKRCRPDNPDHDVARIEAVARHIEAHAADRLTLAHLAKQANLSPAHLQRAFKRVMGVSPKAYQDAVRFRQMKAELRAGNDVTSAMHAAGFSSSSRVYGTPARSVGMAPGAYRKGGAGETLYHACRETALGPLMMAATERGICFAMFGDSEDALAGQLAKEFPSATLVPSPAAGDVALDAWMAALDAYLSDNAPRPELPLDLRGTAFQSAVWKFLLSTTSGEVLSYGELASGIGKPSASRAVTAR